MKVETPLCLEGKTKLVEDSGFPLKVRGYKEVFCDEEGRIKSVRQYMAEVEYCDDKFQLTGENQLEVVWKIAKVLLALLGEVKV
ncbi:MAG: hypothetical protein QXI91_07635 [Candidatus Bathyarchaeia archaeon]